MKRKEPSSPTSSYYESKDSKEDKVDVRPERKQRMTFWDDQASLSIIDFSEDRDVAASDVDIKTSDGKVLHFHRMLLQGKVLKAAFSGENKGMTEITIQEDSKIANFLLNLLYRNFDIIPKFLDTTYLDGWKWSDFFNLSRMIYKYDIPELQCHIFNRLSRFRLPWPLKDIVEWLESIKEPHPCITASSKWLELVSKVGYVHSNDVTWKGPDPGQKFWMACMEADNFVKVDPVCHIREVLPHLEESKCYEGFIYHVIRELKTRYANKEFPNSVIMAAPSTGSIPWFLRRCAMLHIKPPLVRD